MEELIPQEIIQNEGDYQGAGMVADAAYDDIGILDKQIEPSTAITAYATRNQQMGNVDGKHFKELAAKKDAAVFLLNIPKPLGGWLSKRFGRNILKGNELEFVMSNSINGAARSMLNTRKAIISKQEGNSKAAKGIGNGIGN